MDLIPDALDAAASAARGRLQECAWRAAAAGAGPASAQGTAALAGAAREAVFSDALLAAMHERLSQLKAVTK
jgi:hypothetical protein